MVRLLTIRQIIALGAVLAVGLPASTWAHDPEFTDEFDRDGCTFAAWGNNPYFPLWPGYSLLLEGAEEDDGEVIEISVLLSVLTDTEIVDGVETRVVEEREWEDGELVEVSRNFMATCRETGSVWYFGEDVDDYEDGEIVGHEGGWRTGMDSASPGLLMPGTPLVGARFQQENAPGVAEDRAEIVSRGNQVMVEAGAFDDVLEVIDTNPLEEEEEGDVKLYARGVGLIMDEELELVEITLPPCMPDATTLCLNNGRYAVEAQWTDHDLVEGDGMVNQISDDSGEFWFFDAGNVELLVKVLNACALPQFNSYWFFAAGLTNVEVTLTVTDTETDMVFVYENPLGNPFDPILDTTSLDGCP